MTRSAARAAAADRSDPGSYPEIHPPVRGRADGAPARTLLFLHGGNVANWMWDQQVKGFPDYRVFTPHLPGFGARAAEDWAGLESAADDVAAFVADQVEEGGVHVVGLSLGGVVALRLMARHPELVDSALVSGVPARGIDAAARQLARLQVRLWGREWFWRFQAGAFGIPPDDRRLFADHGITIRPENARRMMAEVYAGGLPAGLGSYAGPVLAVAGSREPPVVRRSFPDIGAALPQADFRLAPSMHHQWSIEDPLLFNSMVRMWVERGRAHPRLLPA
ncbi:MAG: alpha/beta hydrolase [Arthrobacter sp.]|uniref:alpha/beta fold hydrolase n=1 Tax=Arthrobacter sp. TaxID=1667 RepID=UPI003495D3E6